MPPANKSAPIGKRQHWQCPLQRKRAVEGTEERDKHVIEEHGPSGHEPEVGMYPAAYIGVGGAGRGIKGRHPAIADSRQHHGYHGGENCNHHVSARLHLRQSIDRRRSARGNGDDAIEDQIPKCQNPAQAGDFCAGRGFAVGMLTGTASFVFTPSHKRRPSAAHGKDFHLPILKFGNVKPVLPRQSKGHIGRELALSRNTVNDFTLCPQDGDISLAKDGDI